MTYLTIQLKNKQLTGQFVQWNQDDPGFKNYQGSVYFDSGNKQSYIGFVRHDGRIEVKKNCRTIGIFTPLENIAVV